MRSPNGDNYLAASDMRLWKVVYAVLTRYGVPVIFKTSGPHAARGQDYIVQWFIPVWAENYEAIGNFLDDEFASDVRQGQDVVTEAGEASYLWGFNYAIMPFSGITPHLESAEREALVDNAVASFLGALEHRKKKENES